MKRCIIRTRNCKLRGELFMKGERQTATMSDVAREAGVALGTVSKVINGLPVGESYRL